MSTREALIDAISKQPEPLLREVQHYLDFLIKQHKANGKDSIQSAAQWPEAYFENTAGAFENEPFERPSPLPVEKREEW